VRKLRNTGFNVFENIVLEIGYQSTKVVTGIENQSWPGAIVSGVVAVADLSILYHHLERTFKTFDSWRCELLVQTSHILLLLRSSPILI
jgi:hypothetical protein